MSNMQVFYSKVKSSAPEKSTSYQASLEKLTHIELAKLQFLANVLWWGEWTATLPEGTNQ